MIVNQLYEISDLFTTPVQHEKSFELRALFLEEVIKNAESSSDTTKLVCEEFFSLDTNEIGLISSVLSKKRQDEYMQKIFQLARKFDEEAEFISEEELGSIYNEDYYSSID